MNDIPPLTKWVLNNKYYLKSGTKQSKPTHYLLNGGVWKIPMNEYSTFLKLLASDLSNNHKHYLSENKTEIFRFVCDLDFYDSCIINLDEVLTIISKVLSEYYPVELIKIIVCGTETKECTINGESLTKTGIHLVFPKIFLSTNTAKGLRVLFIKKLTEELGERSKNNPWEDVVDKAIYDANGLRMVGCRKISKCTVLENCEKCNGTGKIDEGRVYKPISVYYNNEINIEDKEYYFKSITRDPYVMLLETCIINYSDIPETKLIKELEYSVPQKKKKKRRTPTKIKLKLLLKKILTINIVSISRK